MTTKQVSFRQVLWVAFGAVILSLILSAVLVNRFRKESQKLHVTPPSERPIIVTGGSIQVSTSNAYEETSYDVQRLMNAKLVSITVYNEDDKDDDHFWTYAPLGSAETSIDIFPDDGNGSIHIGDEPGNYVQLTFMPGTKVFSRRPWDDGYGRYRGRNKFKIKNLKVTQRGLPVSCTDEKGRTATVCSDDYHFGNGKKITIQIDTK